MTFSFNRTYNKDITFSFKDNYIENLEWRIYYLNDFKVVVYKV